MKKTMLCIMILLLLVTLASCDTKESSPSDFTSATEWGNMDIRYGTEWNDNAPGMYYGMKSEFTPWKELVKQEGLYQENGKLFYTPSDDEHEDNPEPDFRGTVIMPNNITHIERGVFTYCSFLTNITLPNRLSYIGDEAFLQCGIKELAIPDTVETIGLNAFEGIEHIEYYGKATYPPDNKYWGALSMN